VQQNYSHVRIGELTLKQLISSNRTAALALLYLGASIYRDARASPSAGSYLQTLRIMSASDCGLIRTTP
jgi:hypothetical protein